MVVLPEGCIPVDKGPSIFDVDGFVVRDPILLEREGYDEPIRKEEDHDASALVCGVYQFLEALHPMIQPL